MSKGKWGTSVAAMAYCNQCGVEQTALGRTLTPVEVPHGDSKVVTQVRRMCDDCKARYQQPVVEAVRGDR
jgi:hypothetical protein